MTNSFGLQIRNSAGQFYASPEFTPMTLCQVIDYTMPSEIYGTLYIQTDIPNGITVAMFHRHLGDEGIGYNLKMVSGTNGKQRIEVWRQANTSVAYPNPIVRFYLFAKYITPSAIPDWGVFYYKDNEIYYHGSCLPLQLHYVAPISFPDLPKGKPMACMGTFWFNDLQYAGSETIVFTLYWNYAGFNNGLDGWCYEVLDGNGYYPGTGKGVFYIETEFYDQYYKQSLGYS